MPNIAFTRYLFSREDVELSLREAMKNRYKDEALYWAFELHYSGFDVWPILFDVYAKLWATTSPKYEKYMVEFRQREKGSAFFRDIEDNHALGIGSAISTLCSRDYTVPNTEKFRVAFSESALAPYKTLVPKSGQQPYKYLGEVTKYNVHTTGQNLALENAFLREDWTHYCWSTPYWYNIFKTFGMKHDVLNKQSTFIDDLAKEMFYNEHGYEPDEQSRELERAHGVFI